MIERPEDAVTELRASPPARRAGDRWLMNCSQTVGPLRSGDAVLGGAMRRLDGGRALSLGDRSCLALTVRSEPQEVLTANRAWADLDLPIQVVLIR